MSNKNDMLIRPTLAHTTWYRGHPQEQHKERMTQNLGVFGITHSADDMTQIAAINQHDTGTVNFGDP